MLLTPPVEAVIAGAQPAERMSLCVRRARGSMASAFQFIVKTGVFLALQLRPEPMDTVRVLTSQALFFAVEMLQQRTGGRHFRRMRRFRGRLLRFSGSSCFGRQRAMQPAA